MDTFFLTPEEQERYDKENKAIEEFFSLTKLDIVHRRMILNRRMGEIYPENIVYAEPLLKKTKAP